jgi:hypothetical protein
VRRQDVRISAAAPSSVFAGNALLAAAALYRPAPAGWPSLAAVQPLTVFLNGSLTRVSDGVMLGANASGGASFRWTLDTWSPLTVLGPTLASNGDGALVTTPPGGSTAAATACTDDWATARVDWLSCAQPDTAMVLRNGNALIGAYFRPAALGIYSFSLRASWKAGGWSGGTGDAVPRGAECAEAVAAVAVRVSCNRSPVAVGPGSVTVMRGAGNQFLPIVLLANASFDPDPEDTILAVQWVLVSSPPASRLTARALPGWQNARFVFTPDVDGTYVFTLDVSDGCSSNQARTSCVLTKVLSYSQ